jgi:hypothetical protein
MSLALLLPAGLAALAALLLPLLIHLARRSEQRVTDFAALRWLAPKARPRRKRRFDERLLLCVRLLLLAAIALLLARPVLFGRPDATPWIVAAPGVPASAIRDLAGDDDGGARLRWLAPGFPGLDRPPPSKAAPIASLLRQLDTTVPAGAPLTVLVPPVLDGADAQRPVLGRRVDWRVVAATEGEAADKADPGKASASSATSSPRLVVRHAPDAPGIRYLRAAGIAWQTGEKTGHDDASTDIAEVAQPLPQGATSLAWLAPGPLPGAIRDWIRAGGHALLSKDAQAPELAQAAMLWRDEEGEPLARGAAFGRGRIMQLTRPLAPSAMPQLLGADFPRRLRTLFDDPPPAPARVDAREYAPTTGAPPRPESPRPLSPWLVALVAALFALERWLASGPRREGAP